MEMLLCIKNNKDLCMFKIAKKINCTNSYLTQLAKKFVEEGIISTTKEGRNRYFKLTEKGDRLTTHFSELKGLIYG